MKNAPSTREWWGMLAVAAWGTIIGAISFQGASTGMFVAVLVGPPVAFLLLPRRAFLSWQLFIIAAALSAAYADRGQDPVASIFGPALLGWAAFSLFSLPWPFILGRRAQRAQEQGDNTASTTTAYMGAGLLVFLACGLIIIGIAFSYYGFTHSSDAAHTSASDRAASFIGCVIVSAGIGLAVFLCRRTAELRINKSPEDLFGLLLAFAGLFPLGMALSETFFKTPCAPGESCAPVRGADLFWMWVIAIETVAALVWLIRRGMRAKALERAARAGR